MTEKEVLSNKHSTQKIYCAPPMYPKNVPCQGLKGWGERRRQRQRRQRKNKENETKNTQHTRAQRLLGVAENYSYLVK